MKIFEFAVLFSPAKKDHGEAKIIVQPTTVLAKDLAQANMLAARAIPEEYLSRLDSVEVAVRPF